MELTVLGSSPSFPNPGSASSGYLVRADGFIVLVDCGHGVVGRLASHLRPTALDACLVSHMHPDHVFDLVPLAYSYLLCEARPAPLPLLLPPGGHAYLFRLAEAAGLQEGLLDTAYAMTEYDPGQPLTLGPMSVRFAPTRHFVDGFSIRFDSDGSLVYSSDTAPTDLLVALSRDADLALYEASLPPHAEPPATDGHLTAAQAGSLARAAGVRALLLTHYPAGSADQIRSEAQRTFGAPVQLARDGATYAVNGPL